MVIMENFKHVHDFKNGENVGSRSRVAQRSWLLPCLSSAGRVADCPLPVLAVCSVNEGLWLLPLCGWAPELSTAPGVAESMQCAFSALPLWCLLPGNFSVLQALLWHISRSPMFLVALLHSSLVLHF